MDQLILLGIISFAIATFEAYRMYRSYKRMDQVRLVWHFVCFGFWFSYGEMCTRFFCIMPSLIDTFVITFLFLIICLFITNRIVIPIANWIKARRAGG